MRPQNDTLLFLTPLSGHEGLNLTPYSARGLTQTLEPIIGIGSGSILGSLIRRTINAKLVNLIPTQFRKYQSTITCKDVNTPVLDGAWQGLVVQVDCVHELNYLTGGSPQRSEVSGSSYTEGHFTFYRPQLIMMVLNIKSSRDEYGADYTWSAEFQEV